ncbi:MAG: hypothetical protein ACK4WM_10675 [Thermoflexales bacterium]
MQGRQGGQIGQRRAAQALGPEAREAVAKAPDEEIDAPTKQPPDKLQPAVEDRAALRGEQAEEGERSRGQQRDAASQPSRSNCIGR